MKNIWGNWSDVASDRIYLRRSGLALLVGLTGVMGSGKSIAAEMLRELGAHIIDADEICRSLIEPEKQAWREIVQLFGDEILLPDQTLNRKKLADIVFNDSEKKMALEGILHPKVFAEEQQKYCYSSSS